MYIVYEMPKTEMYKTIYARSARQWHRRTWMIHLLIELARDSSIEEKQN